MGKKKYVTKKRVGVFLPVDDDDEYKKRANKIKKQTGNKKFSKNQLMVAVLQNYIKDNPINI